MNELGAFSSPKVYALITELFSLCNYYFYTMGVFKFELAPESVHLFYTRVSNRALKLQHFSMMLKLAEHGP